MSLICGRNAASDSLISVAVNGEGKIMTVSEGQEGTQDVNVTNASLNVADSGVASALAGTLSVADSAVATQLSGILNVTDSVVAAQLAGTLSTADSDVALALAGTLQVEDSAVVDALGSTLQVQDAQVVSQLSAGIQTFTIQSFQEGQLFMAETIPATSSANSSNTFYPHGNGFIIGGNTSDLSGAVELTLQFSYDSVTWFDDTEAFFMINGQGKFSYKQDKSHAQYYRLSADNSGPSDATITAAAMFHYDSQGVAPILPPEEPMPEEPMPEEPMP
jgi:hypothetical protein